MLFPETGRAGVWLVREPSWANSASPSFTRLCAPATSGAFPAREQAERPPRLVLHRSRSRGTCLQPHPCLCQVVMVEKREPECARWRGGIFIARCLFLASPSPRQSPPLPAGTAPHFPEHTQAASCHLALPPVPLLLCALDKGRDPALDTPSFIHVLFLHYTFLSTYYVLFNLLPST